MLDKVSVSYPEAETVNLYGPPIGRKERVKLPAAPTVVVLVKPVGTNSASTVAPATLTLPLREEVVSTSAVAVKLTKVTTVTKDIYLKKLFIELTPIILLMNIVRKRKTRKVITCCRALIKKEKIIKLFCHLLIINTTTKHTPFA